MPRSEDRYRAYRLLMELDALNSSTMNQVAYGRLGGAEWDQMCNSHRKAFEEWIAFAEEVGEDGLSTTPLLNGTLNKASPK
ncbi:UNVERIFIED_ORG: hypothetical protein J2W16_004035 [Pseudomonas cremoricolorata]|nr:hypothetical protein [Pseudomonas cremoricolorata]